MSTRRRGRRCLAAGSGASRVAAGHGSRAGESGGEVDMCTCVEVSGECMLKPERDCGGAGAGDVGC